MNKKYKVNNIFNESGVTLNELISKFLVFFLDNEANLSKDNLIMNHITIPNI